MMVITIFGIVMLMRTGKEGTNIIIFTQLHLYCTPYNSSFRVIFECKLLFSCISQKIPINIFTNGQKLEEVDFQITLFHLKQ